MAEIKAQRGAASLASEKRWHEARKAGEAKRGNVVLATKPAPVLPQLLQSKEEALEVIAMSKLPVSPDKVDELVEAVKAAVAEWHNPDARVLIDGYEMHQSPAGVYIYLKHPECANRVVVGMVDPAECNLEFVSSRGEILAYMIKVADGPRELKHPALASLNMPDATA